VRYPFLILAKIVQFFDNPDGIGQSGLTKPTTSAGIAKRQKNGVARRLALSLGLGQGE
jgi:hypothetical protein